MTVSTARPSPLLAGPKPRPEGHEASPHTTCLLRIILYGMTCTHYTSSLESELYPRSFAFASSKT